MEANKPERILIDFTKSFKGFHMGIRRVVLNIVHRAKDLEQHSGIPCIPVISRDGFFQMVQDQNIPDFYVAKEKKSKETNKRTFINLNLTKKILSIPKRKAIDYFDGLKNRIHPGKGDLLLMPDAFWGRDNTHLESVERVKRSGGKVVLVIHDLLPYLKPEFFGEEFSINFTERFFQILPLLNGILTVSKTVEKDVKQFLESECGGRFRTLPVDYFWLGADHHSKLPLENNIREEIKEIGNLHPVLFVGMIEVRKDPLTLIEAFDRVAISDQQLVLLLVGKPGFRGEEILSRAKRSPFWGTRLLVRHDIQDGELEFLYENARGLVFCSLAEGFGIPIIEAIYKGIPVICSDIPIFREIGGDYPLYFKVKDVEDLAKTLKEIPSLPIRRIQNIPPILTWDHSVHIFLKKSLNLVDYCPIQDKNTLLRSQNRF